MNAADAGLVTGTVLVLTWRKSWHLGKIAEIGTQKTRFTDVGVCAFTVEGERWK